MLIARANLLLFPAIAMRVASLCHLTDCVFGDAEIGGGREGCSSEQALTRRVKAELAPPPAAKQEGWRTTLGWGQRDQSGPRR